MEMCDNLIIAAGRIEAISRIATKLRDVSLTATSILGSDLSEMNNLVADFTGTGTGGRNVDSMLTSLNRMTDEYLGMMTVANRYIKLADLDWLDSNAMSDIPDDPFMRRILGTPIAFDRDSPFMNLNRIVHASTLMTEPTLTDTVCLITGVGFAQALPMNVKIKPSDLRNIYSPEVYRANRVFPAFPLQVDQTHIIMNDDAIYLVKRTAAALPNAILFETNELEGITMLRGSIETVSVADELSMIPQADNNFERVLIGTPQATFTISGNTAENVANTININSGQLETFGFGGRITLNIGNADVRDARAVVLRFKGDFVLSNARLPAFSRLPSVADANIVWDRWLGAHMHPTLFRLPVGVRNRLSEAFINILRRAMNDVQEGWGQLLGLNRTVFSVSSTIASIQETVAPPGAAINEAERVLIMRLYLTLCAMLCIYGRSYVPPVN